MEHPATVLLVGEVTDLLVTPLQRAQAAGWRFVHKADVYAAASRLLSPREPTSAVVVVVVESLRGDELRFFDFLTRRLPAVSAVAVYAASAEDRRLEACRRRNVTVLSAANLATWLTSQQPATVPAPSSAAGGPPASAIAPSPTDTGPTDSGLTSRDLTDRGVTPYVVKGSGPVPQSSPHDTPSKPTDPQANRDLPPAVVQGSNPVSHADAPPAVPPDDLSLLAGIEVDLDIPDELADLPDLDEMQVELAGPTEYSEDDLPESPDDSDIYIDPLSADLDELEEDELPAEQEEDDAEQEEGDEDLEEEDLPKQVPLTPWSAQPRPERRPPRRSLAAQPPAEPPQVTPPASAPPETPSSQLETRSLAPQPAVRPPPPRDWEHGLLTPDELRALLQDPDEGQGEARP